MKHLGEQGLIVYLDVSCEEIIRRVNNISTRGIAMKPGKTLADLYEERKPYYEKYAQLTIPCDGKTMEQCVQAIALAVDNPVRMC
jgi:shikimate kinase